MKFEKAFLSVTAILVLTVVVFVVLPSGKTPKDSAAETKETSRVESLTVKVFFGNSRFDPEASGEEVFAVEHRIQRTQAVARGALEELLKGPTDEETAQDYFTSINSGVRIQRLVIADGTAMVDFDEQLEFRVGGACRVSAIRAQITQTLKQFPTVDEVVITINGRTRDILQP
jgi:spore germination protein GerM